MPVGQSKGHVERSCELRHAACRRRVTQHKKSFGTLEDSSVFSKIRKDIARIQTEATSREKKQGLPKNGLKALYRKTFVAEKGTEENAGNFLQDIADKLS